MSDIVKTSIKKALLKMDCHFTWVLLKEDIDPDELEERIADQIEFLHSKSKIQNYHLLAYVNYLNGKKEEALKNLQKAEEAVKTAHPRDAERQSLVTRSNYAWLYYHMDKLAEAQEYIDKIERTCKEHGSATPYKIKLPQILCEKGWALLKFGGKNYEKAKESFAKALQEDPDNPEFNVGYAITVYRLEDHYGKQSAAEGSSLEPLRRAVQLDPDDVFVVPILAIKLQEIGNTPEGEEYIEKALEKHPGVPYVLRYAAKFYRKKGDVQRALKYLTEALSLTPNSAFLHHQVAICYRKQFYQLKKANGRGQPTEEMEELIRLCIDHLKIVVERKTKFFYAHLDLANMYAERAQLEEAEEMFQRVFAMSTLNSLDKQQLYVSYGNFMEFHRRSESEALKFYLAAVEIDQESIDRKKAICNLKRLMEKRIKRGLADAKSLATLGFAHRLHEEKKEAIECYERALKLDPGNEEYLSALLDLRLSLQS
ncbi:interferon-induced protein with tetratricopeptide repeats 5-like [Anolis carolinensis]|uniref:interferon-induced protein with tetratricopeptide repeats 5-like n=1 Tax=Anolis carolinensis TaxID=28377 RepID=UPI002F2B58E9